MSADIHGLSGAYAVDGLDERERAAFEKHLAQCTEMWTITKKEGLVVQHQLDQPLKLLPTSWTVQ